MARPLCATGSRRATTDGALPLARREQQAESRARRAVAWLQAAHKAGHFKPAVNLAHLQKAPDLDPLRNRADFKAFVAGLAPK